MKKKLHATEERALAKRLSEEMGKLDDRLIRSKQLTPEMLRVRLEAQSAKKQKDWVLASWPRKAALISACAMVGLVSIASLSALQTDPVWLDAGMSGQSSEEEMQADSPMPQSNIAGSEEDGDIHLRSVFKSAASEYTAVYEAVEEICGEGWTAMPSFETGAVSNDLENTQLAMPEASTGTGDKTNVFYTETNTQVAGVDEADIVKTDGQYLYTLSDSAVRITDVNDPVRMQEVATISATEEGERFLELYLLEDRLVVLSEEPRFFKEEPEEMTTESSVTDPVNTPMMPVYYGNNGIKVTVYDITDRTQPEQIRTYTQEGSYLSSRMTDGYLYLISTKYLDAWAIQQENPETYVPCYRDGDQAYLVPASGIRILPDGEAAYTVLGAVNCLDIQEQVSVASILGTGSEVYMDSEAVYIAAGKNEWNENGGSANYTKIFKYAAEDGNIAYIADTQLAGSINDQFSMQTSNGVLQVAVNVYQYNGLGGSYQASRVYTLDENLELIGQTKDLAEGENLHSVRYIGDMAYLVTFRNTDPLFVVDLSNPEQPEVLGELKIPGFSEYLHPYGEDLLIGFGYDADEETGRTGAMKLSLFDVSDPTDPREIQTSLLDAAYDYSEAIDNHKAFLFDAERALIGIPSSGWGVHGYTGVYLLYQVDPEEGFQHIATIQRQDAEEEDSLPERGVRIDDVMFTVSDQWILATDLNTLKEIGELVFSVEETLENDPENWSLMDYANFYLEWESGQTDSTLTDTDFLTWLSDEKGIALEGFSMEEVQKRVQELKDGVIAVDPPVTMEPAVAGAVS